MPQKFIITRHGYLRLGHVGMHRHLLLPQDACIGGGLWHFDPIGMQLELSGRSYDFGSPMWDYLCDNHIVLKVPLEYQELRIVYKADTPDAVPFCVTKELKIEYV